MTNVTAPTAAAAALFTTLVDDAALFPPQEAPMTDAVREHAAHRASPYGFLQGAFVVAARRVRELLAVHREIAGSLRLSLVVDYADFDGSIAEVADALVEPSARDVSVAMVELRLPSAEIPTADLGRACQEALRAWRSEAEPPAMFLESARMMAARDEPQLLAHAVASLREGVAMPVGAKLRTGGVTSDAVPPSALVARFIAAMHHQDVPWKATAGLHHPVRGVYGGQMMHGFLNLLAATVGAQTGALTDEQLVDTLNETQPEAFRLTDAGFCWRSVAFDLAAMSAARRRALRSFGSCSFDEPVEGLRDLGMLP
jgi:hypothetical protein